MDSPVAKKRKLQPKKKFYPKNKKQYLEVGQRGFLATCNLFERNCIQECNNILNQHADELYGINGKDHDVLNTQDSEKTDDIADVLQKQIDEATQVKTKSTKKPRFQVVDTGVRNCVFIKTTLEDPKAIVEHIVNDIAETKQQKTRFLLRLVPIEAVCKANHKDIVNAAGQLCDKYFLKENTTFSVVFNKRFNNSIDRNPLIHDVWELIHGKNVKNKVDLKYAKRSLIIEVLKGLCCLAVVDNYMSMKRYNLVELARANLSYSEDDNKNKQIKNEKDEETKVCESTQEENHKKTLEAKTKNEVSIENEEV